MHNPVTQEKPVSYDFFTNPYILVDFFQRNN
jgi:hypothetical protein